MPDKRFVYLLRSQSTNRPYFGLTADIATRLAAHNAGQNKSTAPFRPWTVVTSIEFSDEKTAARFEQFLKTGSGRAFASSTCSEREVAAVIVTSRAAASARGRPRPFVQLYPPIPSPVT